MLYGKSYLKKKFFDEQILYLRVKNIIRMQNLENENFKIRISLSICMMEFFVGAFQKKF